MPTTHPSFCCFCAQRLTASKELEPYGERFLTRVALAPCSTPYGIKGIGTTVTPTWTFPGFPTPEPTCSTPYGIKGIGTSRISCIPSFLLKVLNALRHQRNWNRALDLLIRLGAGSAQRLTASKELERATVSPLGVARGCAQRLTASKELELRSLERHPRAGL